MWYTGTRQTSVFDLEIQRFWPLFRPAAVEAHGPFRVVVIGLLSNFNFLTRKAIQSFLPLAGTCDSAAPYAIAITWRSLQVLGPVACLPRPF